MLPVTCLIRSRVLRISEYSNRYGEKIIEHHMIVDFFSRPLSNVRSHEQIIFFVNDID